MLLAAATGIATAVSLPAVLGNLTPLPRGNAATTVDLAAAGETVQQGPFEPTSAPGPDSASSPLPAQPPPAASLGDDAAAGNATSHRHRRRPHRHHPTTSPTSHTPTASPTATGRLMTAYVTGYTWQDNDPPGGAIADPVIHRTAGGTGTYADPITLAVAEGAFRPGVRMYIADLQRYFIVEDTCASCGQRPVWIDLWLDGREGSAAETQDCAERLTRDYSVLVDAGPGLPVSPGSLYGENGCYR